MKGELPVNLIVVVVIALAAISALLLFIFSSTSAPIFQTEAQRSFSTSCARYCKPDLYETLQGAYSALKNDKPFIEACVKLGYIEKDSIYVNRCLGHCGNCNLKITDNDVNEGFSQIGAVLGQG